MNYNEFLYLYIVEKESGNNKVDNMFRIVYWPSDDSDGDITKGTYVLYGTRASDKKSGKFIPYRLEFASRSDVISFLRFTIGEDANMSVELHHYAGWYDDSLDSYHIDWDACKPSPCTEIVAYDAEAEIELNKCIKDNTLYTGLDIIRYAIKV